jgi:hypothetical protein
MRLDENIPPIVQQLSWAPHEARLLFAPRLSLSIGFLLAQTQDYRELKIIK